MAPPDIYLKSYEKYLSVEAGERFGVATFSSPTILSPLVPFKHQLLFILFFSVTEEYYNILY